MQEWAFIILTLIIMIFEVYLTALIVKKIKIWEEKVNDFHEKFILISTEVLVINEKISQTIKKLNKVLRFITNEKFYRVANILKIAFNTAQIFILIRSIDFSRKKFHSFKILKNLLISEVIRNAVKKFILYSVNHV